MAEWVSGAELSIPTSWTSSREMEKHLIDIWLPLANLPLMWWENDVGVVVVVVGNGFLSWKIIICIQYGNGSEANNNVTRNRQHFSLTHSRLLFLEKNIHRVRPPDGGWVAVQFGSRKRRIIQYLGMDLNNIYFKIMMQMPHNNNNRFTLLSQIANGVRFLLLRSLHILHPPPVLWTEPHQTRPSAGWRRIHCSSSSSRRTAPRYLLECNLMFPIITTFPKIRKHH